MVYIQISGTILFLTSLSYVFLKMWFVTKMYYFVEVFINSLGNLPDITIEQDRFTILNIWMSDSTVTARAIEKHWIVNSEI